MRRRVGLINGVKILNLLCNLYLWIMHVIRLVIHCYSDAGSRPYTCHVLSCWCYYCRVVVTLTFFAATILWWRMSIIKLKRDAVAAYMSARLTKRFSLATESVVKFHEFFLAETFREIFRNGVLKCLENFVNFFPIFQSEIFRRECMMEFLPRTQSRTGWLAK